MFRRVSGIDPQDQTADSEFWMLLLAAKGARMRLVRLGGLNSKMLLRAVAKNVTCARLQKHLMVAAARLAAVAVAAVAVSLAAWCLTFFFECVWRVGWQRPAAAE